MYPKTTKEVLLKFISNEKLFDKGICIVFETEFDYGRFLTFLDKRGITWRGGVGVFDTKFDLSNPNNFRISIFYKTFEGITWCHTSALGEEPEDCMIYKLDTQVLNEFFN